MAAIKDFNKGIFTIDFDVSEAFGGEVGDFKVTLREPTTEEVMRWSGKDNTAITTELLNLLQSAIVDHTFFDEQGKQYGNQKVAQELKRRSGTALEIVQKWMESSPLGQRMNNLSRDTQETSSKEQESQD